MNVKYKREMRHNYLILEALEKNLESFEIRMLAVNTIEGILKLRIKQEEDHTYYYYEITSRQPLSRLLEFKEIKQAELGSLITGIGSILNRLESYLLQEGNILLEPEYIYIDPESFQVWLCYVPGYKGDFPAAMEKLLQFLLKKADHQDNDTVVLAYRLYQESQKDYYGMEDLLKAVQESQKGKYQRNSQENLQRNIQKISQEGIPGNASNNRNPEDRNSWEKDEEEEWFPETENFQKNSHEWENIEDTNYRDMQIPDYEKSADKKRRKLVNESEDKRKEIRRCKRQKESKFAAFPVIILAFFCPLSVWFFAGEAGIRQHRNEIIVVEAVLLAVFLFLLLRKKKSDERSKTKGKLKRRINDKRRESGKRGKLGKEEKSGRNLERDSARKTEKTDFKKDLPESKWDMTFEEDEEGEAFENTADLGQEKGRKQQKVWTEDFDNEHESKESTAWTGEQNKDTMLLAEMEPSAKKPHLLKSLDPSVEDISVPYFPFIIGKQEGIVDYVLKKPTVSRLHIRIDQEEGKYKITDLNSSNGTIVAGQCLEANESCLVSSGDEIQIADLSYVFY